ncbi:hypothetical protein [Leptospira adleri]|uniref:hypothetical protein n=1 Tax=Leptospira adleri TaxID=2023186 RepID=UPI001083C195|nr:hypothetical protein [Leptospira adleri]TGM58552.1 hypothetical protein EHQ97_05495 [Leptospira adleri]
MCVAKVIYELIPVIIGLLALVIAFVSFVGQMMILVLNQLSEKAKDCNNAIAKSNFIILPNDFLQVSNILSSIITAIQLMDYHFNRRWYFKKFISRQQCLDQFYLQLHTSIQIFIGRDRDKYAAQLKELLKNETINQLFKDASANLYLSYKNYP